MWNRLFLTILLPVFAAAQTVTPVSNGRLVTALDANGQDIVKADEIKFGPGNDVTLGRSSNSTLTLTGNLTVTGSVDFPAGSVAWVDVNKVGSSLADLSTRSAADLTTGTLAVGRLPAFSGDATSSAGSSALTLSNTGVVAGTYRSVTVDAKGRVSSGTNPTTLSGYGITDAQPLDADLTAISALSTAAYGRGLLTLVDAQGLWNAVAGWRGLFPFEDPGSALGGLSQEFLIWSPQGGGVIDEEFAGWVDASTFRSRLGLTSAATGSALGLTSGTLPAARLPAFSGDATSLAGNSTLTLANTGVVGGTYRSVTVDAKGRVTAGTSPTTLSGYGITDAQPLDGNLTALASNVTTGLWTITAAGSAGQVRAITAGTGVTVTNGNGVSGNPTVAIGQSVATTSNVTFNAVGVATGVFTSNGSNGFTFDSTQSGWGQVTIGTPSGGNTLNADIGFGPGLSANRSYTFPDASGTIALAATTLAGYGITDAQPLDADLTAFAANATQGFWAYTGAGTGAARTITGPAAGITVTNGAGTAGNPTLALANDLAALEGLSINGVAVRTGTDTWTTRTLTGPAAGITVSNGDGVAGNPTLALANDLGGVEGLSTTGVAVRTASDTWTTRTITGTANQITVTNGDGVAGSPTISIPTNPTFPGNTTIGVNLAVNGSMDLPTDGSSIRFANTGTNGQIQTSGGAFTISNAAGPAGADVLFIRTANDRNVLIAPISGTTGSVKIGYTNASSSKDTGSLVVEGGIGAESNIWSGTSLNAGNSTGASVTIDGLNRTITTDAGSPIVLRRVGNYAGIELTDNAGSNYSRWASDATRRHIWASNGGGTTYSQINSAGDFQTNFGRVKKVNVVTGNTTLDATHHVVVCNSASAMTLTLPSASTNTGREYQIKNKNTGTVTVSGANIDGAASFTLPVQYQSIILISDGTEWGVY